MKTLRFVLLSCFVALLLGVLSHCKGKSGDPTPSEVTKISGLLVAAPWQIQSVSVDDVAHNELFTNLKLTFTASGYTTVNGGAIWPATGTWNFTDQTATAFIRDDGVEVTISEISDARLVLSLLWTKTTLGGRVNSISGKNVFTFTK